MFPFRANDCPSSRRCRVPLSDPIGALHPNSLIGLTGQSVPPPSLRPLLRAHPAACWLPGVSSPVSQRHGPHPRPVPPGEILGSGHSCMAFLRGLHWLLPHSLAHPCRFSSVQLNFPVTAGFRHGPLRVPAALLPVPLPRTSAMHFSAPLPVLRTLALAVLVFESSRARVRVRIRRRRSVNSPISVVACGVHPQA